MRIFDPLDSFTVIEGECKIAPLRYGSAESKPIGGRNKMSYTQRSTEPLNTKERMHLGNGRMQFN